MLQRKHYIPDASLEEHLRLFVRPFGGIIGGQYDAPNIDIGSLYFGVFDI